MNLRNLIYTFSIATLTMGQAYAQSGSGVSVPANATLQQLIDFALQNGITIKQAALDQQITEKDIDISLSGWYPQLTATAGISHLLKIPVVNFNGNNVVTGQKNNSMLNLNVDQQILNPALMQAKKAAGLLRQSSAQNAENIKITTVVEVSKAYYDILTSEEHIKITQENITRLQKQLSDAKSRYEVGLVDKTDFKRAQIALANSEADYKRTVELRKFKYEYIKQLLALNKNQSLTLSFNNANMEHEILLDTNQTIDVTQRIEYQQLQTSKKIQELSTQYYKWTYLPNLSAYGNYIFNYRDNEFNNLFQNNFPSSTVGLNLSVPIFQGFKRKNQISKSKLQETRIDWDIKKLENSINTELALAKASYAANLIDWKTAKENSELSKEVYETIKLQYNEGIKTYLDLMTAETDLKTAQLNYLNALYALLSSKLDVQKALGNIQTN